MAFQHSRRLYFDFMSTFMLVLLSLNDVHSQDISKIERRLQELEKENGILTKKIRDLEENRLETQINLETFPIRYNDGNEETFKRDRKGSPTHEVAFMASLTPSKKQFSAYTPVVFNKIITNIGGHYDSRTGIFRTPVRGVYLFNTNAVAYRYNAVKVAIMVNGVSKVYAVSDRQGSLSEKQGVASAILCLGVGEEVTVQPHTPSAYTLEGNYATTFSGYLLHPRSYC